MSTGISLHMPPINSPFNYRVAESHDIDVVRELWGKLNAHHAGISSCFGEDVRCRSFEARKQELLAKAAIGKIRVELASAGLAGPAVAYCISTITRDSAGEVDSLFVEECFRGRGIGSELMRRALAWLDSMKAASKVVSVLNGNDEALAFYRRFGFQPRSILLQQTPRKEL